VRLSGARFLKFRGNPGESETSRIGGVQTATFIAGISGASLHSAAPNALSHDCRITGEAGLKGCRVATRSPVLGYRRDCANDAHVNSIGGRDLPSWTPQSAGSGVC